MKKLFFTFIVFVVMFFIPNVEATTALEENQLLIINNKTISKDTSIEEINNMFGEPKAISESAFGGNAYSYCDDEYTWYLSIETDANGNIKGYGTINGDFKARNFEQGDTSDGTYWYLSGTVLKEWSTNQVYAVYEYNCTSADVNKYWENYTSSSKYLYDLQKHSAIASKVLAVKNGYQFTHNSCSEDIFYINEQLKDNSSNLYKYASVTGKTKMIVRVSERLDNFYADLPNPIRFGRQTEGYEYSSAYQYVLYDFEMTNPSIKQGYTRMLYIDPSFLDEKKIVELTTEEKQKLLAAQEEYKKYNEYGQAIENEYDEEPSLVLPLSPGKYNSNALLMATSLLNVARAGIGLGTVDLNEEIAECAQYKATLVYYMNSQGESAGHFPSKPDYVDDEFYNKAQSYMNENLYTGTIESSIINALNDAYGDPIECGHRYNLLWPSYTEWGVGSVKNQGAHKFYGTRSYDNELVAWPSNGIFPLDLAGKGIGNWTAYFYKNYSVSADTEVTINCLTTGKTYEITNENKNEDGKFLQNTGSYLLTFRDDTITYEDGDIFEITLHNVINSDGNTVDYTYRSVFTNFYLESSQVAVTDISVGSNSINVGVNKSNRIIAKAMPEDADNKLMKFTSLDENVATVRQDGTVIGKKVGTTQIKIECGNIQKLINVNVIIPLESISLPTTKNLYVNNSLKLDVTYNPVDTTEDKTVTWTSSDEKVATVDSNGNIIAISGGKTTITAIVGDKRATCIVNVIIPIDSISLDKSSFSIVSGNEKKLNITILPENTTEDKTITWTSSDESVATVTSDGKVIAKNAGTSIITATTVNGKVATCEVKVKPTGYYNEFVTVDGKTYYYNDDGVKVTGWQNIDNNTYYFDNNGIMLKGITEIDGKKYFLGVTKGKVMKGWLTYNGLTYYMDEETGEMASRVTIIDGKAYFFGIKTNKLMKGLINDNGTLYYANEEGLLQTGMVQVGENWYYFGEEYKAETGFKEIDGLTYYFDPEIKIRAKGITEIDGVKYFFGINKGKMMKGWLTYNGLTYYMNEETGEMASGVTIIDGKAYFFGIKTNKLMKGLINYNGTLYYANEEGLLQTGMVQVGENWYYFGEEYKAETGFKKINGLTYYFDPETKIRAKGITEIDGVKYFFGINKGKMMKGWLTYNGLTYYMNEETGEMASGVTIIDGKAYFFGIKTNKLMKGLINYNGTLYYANEEGLLQTGMAQIGENWYYFGEEYKAETGFKKINGLRYYFDPETKIRAKGITEIDGVKYFFGINKGKMMKGWLTYNGLTYYMNEETGEMASGVTIIDGKVYFFGIKTNKLMKGLINYNGTLYYANEEGLLQTGRQVINGTEYNFDSETYQAI